MYLSIKAATMAASLLAPPSYEQIQEFFAHHAQPAAQSPNSEVAEATEHELFPYGDFSYLPPWEATDLIDPPLPSATDDTEHTTEDEQVAINDSGLVAPLPAYWVAGTDEPEAATDAPETEETSTDTATDWPAYLDGTDDDLHDDLADNAYEAPYTADYYRDMNSKGDSPNEADAATEVATDEETVAQPTVEDSGENSLDSEWYDNADTEDPFGPVADEYSDSDESTAESLDAANSELPTEPIANQYEPYAELNSGENTEAAETSQVDSSSASDDRSRTADTAAELAIDPALIRVIADWHQLSPESRQAILTVVQQDSLQPAHGN